MPSREVSTYEIVLHAIDNGKIVFVPYIHQNRTDTSHKPISMMDMLALHSKEDLESLKPDAWGIPTLDESSVASRENALSGHGIDNVVTGVNRAPATSHGLGLDMMLVPGVAFDMENRRLGHGKGFYDRYLQRYKDTVASRSEARMPRLGKNWVCFPRADFANAVPVVGLALKEQMLPKGTAVPAGRDDWVMDQVITGARD